MLGRKSKQAADAPADVQKRSFDDFTVSLGDVMRGERATMGKSLMDVQRELKIKAAYVAAVEDADPSVFDTPGFIAGYVRSYAKYLGLDSEWVFDKFCAESGFATIHGMSERALPARMSREDRMAAIGAGRLDKFETGATPFVPPSESVWVRFNAKAIGSSIILVALIAALGYGGYSVVQQIQQVQMAPIEQPPFVASDIDPLAPRATQLNDQAASADGTDAPVVMNQDVALDRLYRPVALEAPVVAPRDGPISRIDPNTLGNFAVDDVAALATPPTGIQSDLATMIGPSLPNVSNGTAVQVVEDKPKEIVLFSTAGVWLHVQDAGGSSIYRDIMEPGNQFVVPLSETAIVMERAGNSGSLFFKVNGAVYGPAGPAGQLVKGVDLTEDTLTERYQEIPADQQDDLLRNALDRLESVLASQ